jgi:type IV pilus assembly protein PilA
MKNKGFSLVELIIVIAIMAILAAAIAPALIRYIDKSRRGDDVQAAATINTAVTATLANEDAYDEVAAAMTGTDIIATANAHGAANQTYLFAKGSSSKISNGASSFLADLNSNLGQDAPRIKYTKNFGTTSSAFNWNVKVNKAGKPVVELSVTSGGPYELQPSIHPSYK